MSIRLVNRPTLLSRWTLRYVLTLFIGLLTIALATVLYIREATIHERKQALADFAQEAGRYIAGPEGRLAVPGDLYEWIDQRQRQYALPGQFALAVYDRAGKSLYVKKGPTGIVVPPLDPAALNEGAGSLSRTASGPEAFVMTTPLSGRDGPTGAIVIAYAQRDLGNVQQNYTLIVSLLLCAGLLGWTIIYLLSWQLRKPIVQLSEALNRMEEGDYNVTVPSEGKEREMHQLLSSFQTLASRLAKLEELRTELLAGVTHELKTPIASIHGLIRAVRDGVVTEREAEEFLDISLKQTRRLQHMVTDLLDFNAFASGQLNVRREPLELGKLLGEIVYQWEQLHPQSEIAVSVHLPGTPCPSAGDASRIQQIIVNLLNNSRQAIEGAGQIDLTLAPAAASWEVEVRDDGPGIPEAEQANIFERYFRGAGKKLSVGGLGLGLTYSRMLAVAMQGQLQLKHSSPQGTAFQLLLPRLPEEPR